MVLEEQIEQQLMISRLIRDSWGVDIDARGRNSYELDTNFYRLYVWGRISQLIHQVGISPEADMLFSRNPIDWCCCNASEPLHLLSLAKYEWILIWIKSKKGDSIIVLWSMKANKEGVWLGDKNTLITWVNTAEIPAGTICSIDNPRVKFARPISKITSARQKKTWPAIVIIERMDDIFPLRLAYPLQNQSIKWRELHEILYQRRQEVLSSHLDSNIKRN